MNNPGHATTQQLNERRYLQESRQQESDTKLRVGVDAVEVDLADTLGRWTTGQPLSEMADDLLSDVPDQEWRLEQMVDRASRGFGHAISWMIATVVERANAILALYVRFGVDSPV